MLQLREEIRERGAIQVHLIKVADIILLPFRQLPLVHEVDALRLQILHDILERLLQLAGIRRIQLIDLLKDALGVLALLLDVLVLALHDAVQGSHAHPEELVQVVRVDAQEGKPLQQRHVLLRRLQQDSLIKIHPADVALHIARGRKFPFRLHTIISPLLFASKVRENPPQRCYNPVTK